MDVDHAVKCSSSLGTELSRDDNGQLRDGIVDTHDINCEDKICSDIEFSSDDDGNLGEEMNDTHDSVNCEESSLGIELNNNAEYFSDEMDDSRTSTTEQNTELNVLDSLESIYGKKLIPKEVTEADTTPLYSGSSITLLEAVAEHLFWFTNHPGTSKQAVSDILSMQHHTILPKGNVLPDSYQKAMKVAQPFMMKPITYDVCPNDCIIFRNNNSDLEKCPKCSANRFKSEGKSARTFQYLPLGPRLKRLFGTSSLAKLVQEHGMSSTTVLHDIHDSPSWKYAYGSSGVFEGDSRGISLNLCSDGVNPFSHLRCSYSMWPIVMTLLNLPRRIRNEYCNMLLIGIIPANNKKEAHNIHPYLEVLVDELLSLSNVVLYDAYKEVNFKLKVEVLFYCLDYPGIGKLFNFHGAGSYKGCLWCDIKGNFKRIE